MSTAKPKQYFVALQRRIVGNSGVIEWEELPSLFADAVARRLVNLGGRRGVEFQTSSQYQSAWDSTEPAALDPATESGPFQESLDGLVTREVREPDVFRHFFK